MAISKHLFPTSLTVTPSGIRRILFIGSCVAENAIVHFREKHPETKVEFELFNNVLPPRVLSADEVSGIDFQVVLLSLRDTVTDAAIFALPSATTAEADALWLNAMANLEASLVASLSHNATHGLLSFVGTFCVPQVSVMSALNLFGSRRDFTALVRALNARIAEIVAGIANAYVIDVDLIGSALGKSSFQDDSISFSSHGAYWTARHIQHDTNPSFGAPPRLSAIPDISLEYGFRDEEFLDGIWRQLDQLFRVVRQLDPVKLVIFDLDDTMWRGQIAEHYGDGVDWPQPHGWPVGIWDAIYQLRGRGILTAICSKNDEGLVRARWDRASHWLTLDDFTFRMINWRAKAANVAEIMRQANLTAKSVVFVDDNPVEREAVTTAFPEIRTLGANPYVTRRELLWSSETQVPFLTEVSATRETMIRAQQEREHERAALSRPDFLRGLRCEVSVHQITGSSDSRLARSIELINKTNQFNTTGERISYEQCLGFLNNGGKLYAFEVSDKFTKYGLVGVVRLKAGRFVQFAMSCRVLGLGIEGSVISYLVATELNAGSGPVFEGIVRLNEVNKAARNLYLEAGFTAAREGVFVLSQRPPKVADHLGFTPPFPTVDKDHSWKLWRIRKSG